MGTPRRGHPARPRHQARPCAPSALLCEGENPHFPPHPCPPVIGSGDVRGRIFGATPAGRCDGGVTCFLRCSCPSPSCRAASPEGAGHGQGKEEPAAGSVLLCHRGSRGFARPLNGASERRGSTQTWNLSVTIANAFPLASFPEGMPCVRRSTHEIGVCQPFMSSTRRPGNRGPSVPLGGVESHSDLLPHGGCCPSPPHGLRISWNSSR